MAKTGATDKSEEVMLPGQPDQASVSVPKRKSPNATFTLEKADKAIEVLSRGDGAKAAAEAVGVTRRTLYNWRDQNENFRDRWDDAQEGITDTIERTAMRKAIEDRDTTLLIFLLKTRRRNVYQERVEHTGEAGAPLTILIREREDGPQ